MVAGGGGGGEVEEGHGAPQWGGSVYNEGLGGLGRGSTRGRGGLVELEIHRNDIRKHIEVGGPGRGVGVGVSHVGSLLLVFIGISSVRIWMGMRVEMGHGRYGVRAPGVFVHGR